MFLAKVCFFFYFEISFAFFNIFGGATGTPPVWHIGEPVAMLLLPRGQQYRRSATPTAVQRWLARVDPRPRPPTAWY